MKTDEEFRYAVMGLLGMGEVVRRIEEHTRAIKALQRQSAREWRAVREVLKELAELRKTSAEHSKAIQSLQKAIEEHSKAIQSLQKTVERHGELLEAHSQAIQSLQRAVDRHGEAIQSLQKAVEEHSRAIQSLQRAVEAHSQAIQSLQAAVDRHSKVLEDHSKAIRELRAQVYALGTRWGVVAEETFRESVKYLVEDLLGEYEAKKWVYRDEEGFVFGRPAVVEADLLVKDGVHILVEFKASADRGDVYELYKMGQLYEKTTGVKPRLLLVSPAVRKRAAELAEELGIEIRGEVGE